MSNSQLVWLITGAASGFGKQLALEALSRSDKVIATSRSASRLAPLKQHGAETVELDVTSPLAGLHQAAKAATAIYGKIDVLVNSAGYISVGAVEEATPEETYDQFNTNVFGALNITRAFLPYMRERRSGTIAFMGSVGGWRPCPIFPMYAATKYAIRGISESLHGEIAPLELRSIVFEPGYTRTNFLQSGHRGPYENRIEDYKALGEQRNAALLAANGKQPGDPVKASSIIVDVIRGEGVATGKPFPTNLALGSDSYAGVKMSCENNWGMLEEWKDVICSADFPKGS
ncbi:short-chain oxidoreductase [Coniophora puteana RWD-64-598 SS2]|uniref:Short-chain oxidoreductase n=1 Tax=Coniophora puteana (strain RWD-64-598) TaxID=741705 RepID=A0A5M3MLR7_CONPW|nr:short-chain oxidoreductase [Coniophora puteana RWD-64-598 SS2]EIW79920.1 short-chain oxidoreductase [Coniophora puteana RWD-64-598 SS2]